MEAHDVGLPEERLDRDVPGAGRGGPPGVRAVGGGQQADPERPEQLRHPAADGAQPDQPHRAALELDEQPAGPLARPGVPVHRGDAAGDGQHEGDRVLRHGVGVHARRVRHGDAAGAAGGEIDVVGPRAPDRHEAQARARLQHAVGEARVRPDVDDDLRVADPADQLRLPVRAALRVDGDVADGPEGRLGGGAGQGGREVVGDHDLRAHRAGSSGVVGS
jgi:hypothetical protein